MLDTLLKTELAETHGWMTPDLLAERHAFKAGQIWLGRDPFTRETPFGVDPDNHTVVVGASGQGKDASIAVPNACLWPDSLVALDFSGELTALTAQRRNGGSAYSHGIGQNVHVLDPFGVSGINEAERATYNPLDQINHRNGDLLSDVERMSEVLVQSHGSGDVFWTHYARRILSAVICYVTVAPKYGDERNLLTVNRIARKLGDPKNFEYFIEDAEDTLAKAGVNTDALLSVFETNGQSLTTLSSGLATVCNALSFLGSDAIAETVATSSFDAMKELRGGNTVYICLPPSMAEIHRNWARLVVSQIAQNLCKTALNSSSRDRVLFLLNDFHMLGELTFLKDMLAFGRKYDLSFLLTCQSLDQLKHLYPKDWETMLLNCKTRVFLGSTDSFTNQYIADSFAEGGENVTTGNSSTKSWGRSETVGHSISTTYGEAHGETFGPSSFFFSSGESSSESETDLRAYDAGYSNAKSSSRSRSWSRTSGTSYSIGKRRSVGSAREIARVLGAVNDKNHAAFPGLLLVSVDSEPPAILRRTPYFLDPEFLRTFDPLERNALYADRRSISRADEPVFPEKTLEEAAQRIIARASRESEGQSVDSQNALIDDIMKDDTITMKGLLDEFQDRADSIVRSSEQVLSKVDERIERSRRLRSHVTED